MHDQSPYRTLAKAPNKKLMHTATAVFVLGVAVTYIGQVMSKTSDRQQPMDVRSDHSDCTLDDNAPCKFNGNVVITQGSLKINASAAVVHRRNGDLNRAVLTGTPVRLSQQLDNGSDFNAVASTVDYDLSAETVVMSGNVTIDQPGRGSMSGQKVTYNLKTSRVESGGEGNGPVTLRFIPKSAQAKPATQGKP